MSAGTHTIRNTRLALLALCWLASGGARAAGEETAAPAAGRALYVQKGCHFCHGFDGQGALLTGPRLGPEPLPLPAFTAMIRTPRDEMPAYSAAVLSEEEIGRIHDYLAALPKPPEPSALDVFPER
jgi:mono/diheme cytochrome c family protein